MEYVSLFTTVLTVERDLSMSEFMWLCLGLALIGVLGMALALVCSEESINK